MDRYVSSDAKLAVFRATVGKNETDAEERGGSRARIDGEGTGSLHS